MAKRRSLILTQSIARSKRRKKWVALLTVAILLAAGIVIIYVKTRPTNLNDQIAVKGPVPRYDEQEFVSFDQNFSSLYFEVRAVEQQDTSGYGPMYLLNGLTNNGYWYQVGISYHRPFGINNQSYYFNGWVFTCEVWNYAGYSIFQVTGGSPIVRMNIRNGDWVDIDLYFLLNGSIDMKVVDPSTGASESIPYPSFGASFFMGTEKVTSKAGYWTGLMTEWYHVAPYYGNESVVIYESKIDKVQFVNFEIEEFVEGNPSIFEVRTPGPVNLFNYTSTGVSFKYFNATIEWHPYYFTTG